MAVQKYQRRFRPDKAVPYAGRRRTKKRRQFRPETVPDGWAWAMYHRVGNNTREQG